MSSWEDPDHKGSEYKGNFWIPPLRNFIDVTPTTDSIIAAVESADLKNTNSENMNNANTNNKSEGVVVESGADGVLLSTQVACLRIATSVDQLPRIDAQFAQSQQVVSKYSALGVGQGLVTDDKELDQFMIWFRKCPLLLGSFSRRPQELMLSMRPERHQTAHARLYQIL
ncbi:hypothetical protein WN944_013008 [Citrus x changshan-huyou]|uniref:Uncharacterized protein n=1 Tax=Citrus x changshan-huyou TaxID=2935761 RepID=A0AAP0QKB2_9ROSI